MPLFEVPGWTVPSVPSTSSRNGRKRKRPPTNGSNDVKVRSAKMNLEKLVGGIEGGVAQDERNSSQKRQKRRKGVEALDEPKVGRKPPQDKAKAPVKRSPSRVQSRARPKRAKCLADSCQKHTLQPNVVEAVPKKNCSDDAAGLTTLQRKMKDSLSGARFRWINEALYKADSADAQQMVKTDPNLYKEYHEGFRHQVLSWPTNPVSHYVSTFSSYPSRTVIADLGCGDAALARALLPLGLVILSFDLVSDGAYVVEADICGKIPLPGSETSNEDEPELESQGEGQIVDAVVCALSLMGTNWINCIREAWRILRADGELHIAEVTSRFEDVQEFCSIILSLGFKLRSKDESNSHFTLFQFTKIPRVGKTETEWDALVRRGRVLKPCEYKRR